VRDRDNTPKNDHIYSIDGPSAIFPNLIASKADFVTYRASFRDFVRFKFGIDPRTNALQKFTLGGTPQTGFIPTLEGSRGCNLDDWHITFYARRGKGKDENQMDAYVFDVDPVSSSFPQPSGTNQGNGVAKDFPTTSKNAVTEGWTATFKDKQFLLKGTASGDQGMTPLTPVKDTPGEYRIKATNGFVEFTILNGSKGFANDDQFKFSTFKSKAKKVNEIGVGPTDINAEDP
jgi:hypothetical protein